MTAPLTLDNLSYTYTRGDHPAVHDLELRVEAGEILVLLGESGCGKTTTLRLIAGFERPTAGSVHIGDRLVCDAGKSLPPEKRQIGFVFQDYALFPHMTVARNVAYGLRKLPRSQRRARAIEVLTLVGLEAYADRRPDQLSGGQQQRVALARALAPRPNVLLLDEPFSNLDAARRTTTRQDVRELLKQQGVTTILVTHDQEEALSFGDRVAVMRAGGIEQIGRPEHVYMYPDTPYVAGFLGRSNFIEGQGRGCSAMTDLGQITIRGTHYGPVQVALRPEQIELTDPKGASCVATIITRQFNGQDLTLIVETTAGTRYEVHAPWTCKCQPGQEVGIRTNTIDMVLATPVKADQ